MLAQRTRNKHKKIIRREEAQVRNNERSSRSSLEQIVVLDARLGKNIGAKRERTRILDKALVNQLMS